MRESFSEMLLEIAQRDSRMILLTGDHGYALFDVFRRECPNQYLNAGVAEQNMVGVASGLARAGFRPIVYGLSAFIPIRVVEQIKLDVAHDRLPIIFIGDGAGFVYSHLGTSHQSTEDIACARAIPNLHVYSPADSVEMRHCLSAAYQASQPVYIRMGKSDRGAIHSTEVKGGVGDLLKIKSGTNTGISLIATGSLAVTAMRLCDKKLFDADLWTAPFIKPINVHQVKKICDTSRIIITLEEHSIFGGLGSVLTEISSEYSPTHILRIGVEDKFSENCGSYDYLLREHRLDLPSITDRISNFISSYC